MDELAGSTKGAPAVRTIRRQARIAGVIYLLLALTAPLGLLYVPGRILVEGNAAATAENLRASEWVMRLGIASELVHQVIVIFLVLALYRLFVRVDVVLARQVVILGALVSVPIVFVNVLNDVAALTLARGADFLAAFDRAQLDALAYFFLRLHARGITVASIFWGLWLFPFGLLVIRSRFIPSVFGWLLVVAGVDYLASAFATLVMPQSAATAALVALPLEVAELPIIFWLLIRGARSPAGDEPVG
jgi:Domain of unknown function (DUF4386)